MGESASARTERELAELRAAIDADLRMLEERVREDVDPRRLVKRNPIAVFGSLGSVLAVGTVATMRSLAERRRRRSDTDIDALIARLGGRVDKLRGRARKRLRATLRDELADIEKKPRPQQVVYDAAAGALTAALTLVARRFASRLVGDELPREDESTRSWKGAPPPARG